jgi:hypothetical protein
MWGRIKEINIEEDTHAIVGRKTEYRDARNIPKSNLGTGATLAELNEH